MLQNIFTFLFALFDLFVLYILHHYIDEYCSQIQIVKTVLTIMSSFIPILKQIKCSFILKPIQISMQFGFLPQLLTYNAILNFILSMIIRLCIIAFAIVFPFSIVVIMKLSGLLNYVGLLISIYLLVDVSWKCGIYFQYNLKHAQMASLIPGIIFIYSLLTCEGILSKLAILLQLISQIIIKIYIQQSQIEFEIIKILVNKSTIPILQFIITDKGSLITSFLVGIFMMQKSLFIIYILQSLLIYYIIFEMNNKYTRILIGLIISCSIDFKENSMAQILYFSIYVLTLIKNRFKQKSM